MIGGWNWIIVRSENGGSIIELGVFLIDERGNIQQMKTSGGDKSGDSNTFYNIHGNTREGNTGFAGIFRYLQLENDYVINFAEL